MPYAEIIEGFPAELRVPVARLMDELRQELGVQRVDFEELKAIVRDLAEVQKRTEERVEELGRVCKVALTRLSERARSRSGAGPW